MAISLLVHLAVGFTYAVDPEGFSRIFEDTPLEVILVNSRSDEAPVQAQAIAQASLAGGGEVDKGRATSPLPSALRNELGDSAEESHKQIEELQEAQQQLLAQTRRELADKCRIRHWHRS